MDIPQAGKFFVSGGTMPLDSASYIERDSDRLLFESLRAGKFCYVLNSRQMGKSSLSVRVMSKLEQAGVRTTLVDLTRIGGRNVTPTQWYAGLCDAIGAGLGLQSELLRAFREQSELGPMQRFFRAIETVVLEQIPGPVSIFVDEIDATKNLPFEADEFFAGIRECFNRRVQTPVFDRLTFCLIGVAVPTDLIRNPSTTPFNIGVRILLHDFTLDEMKTFSSALRENGRRLVERIHYWTGGQPFLSQTLCEEVARDPTIHTPAAVDELVRARMLEPKARITNINLADVGDRALNVGGSESYPEGFRADLLAAYEVAWRGGNVPDDESNRVAVLLKLSGLMRSDGQRLVVRNRIYREVFDLKWVRDNMPDKERLRERRAFRRGLFRATSASMAILGVVCALALLAWNSGRAAETAKKNLDYELYVADINNMRLLEETGDVSRMEETMTRTQDSPYRGFEWSFWQRRIHNSDEEYTLDYEAPGKREEGLVSQDGREICIRDYAASVAFVVDRQTKHVGAVRQIGRQTRICATRAGFAVVQTDSNDVKSRDLKTDKSLCEYHTDNIFMMMPGLRPRSDYVLTTQQEPSGKTARLLQVIDLVTGRVHGSVILPVCIPDGFFAFNQNGTRVVYTVPNPDHKPGLGAWMVVFDLVQKREVDRFLLPFRAVVADVSDSGREILYQNQSHDMICRNVDAHRDVFRRPWDGANIPNGSVISGDDQSIYERYGDGRAICVDLKTGESVPVGVHVWQLSPTEDPHKLLADATSVRVLPTNGAGPGSVVASGFRIARDDSGGFVAFRANPSGMDRFRSQDFKLVSHSDAPKNLRGPYTYNGRWSLAREPGRQAAIFADTEGKLPGTRISPIPINYSCGISPESLAVLDRSSRKVTGLSGTTGAVRWAFDVPGDPVSGLWVSPEGDTVLALSGDTDMLALDAHTGKLRGTLGGHNVRLSNVSFTADKHGMFTCGADGRVILWDLATLKKIQEFRGNVAQRMACGDRSPDGTRVATCNLAGSWQLWDTRTGIQLMDIQASPLALHSIMFSDDGYSLYTAGDDDHIRRWDTIRHDPSDRIPVPISLLKGITQ